VTVRPSVIPTTHVMKPLSMAGELMPTIEWAAPV
jgi:hypothetical protein